MTVNEWIINWFLENTSVSEEILKSNMNENYLEIGWLDSFHFISFITEIEDHFKIHFSNTSFQDRNFSTIPGLVNIIEVMINEKK